MKNDNKQQKKLTQTDYKKMWGEDGPYSQVRLSEETRILDDSISRVFLVVEAEINPFTFEYIKKNRKQFLDDEPILQLLDHAENRDKFGYVVSAGEIELQDEESKRFARKQADMTIQTLIRMHTFVIKECGIQKESTFGIIRDTISDDRNFVWNEKAGVVDMVEDQLWESESLIGSSSGGKNNKMRFFIVCVFEKNFNFKKQSAISFIKTLRAISTRIKVEIEDAEAFHEYVLITALLSFDAVPAEFIESLVDECAVKGKPIFQKDYFVTNVKKPTQQEILTFLKQLPLDRDIRMKFKE